MVDRAVIHRVVEIGRHGPNSARQSANDLLVNRTVIVGIKLAHIGAIDDINVSVFPRTHRQVMDLPVVIGERGQNQGAPGTEILICVGFLHRIVHGEIVSNLEAEGWRFS